MVRPLVRPADPPLNSTRYTAYCAERWAMQVCPGENHASRDLAPAEAISHAPAALGRGTPHRQATFPMAVARNSGHGRIEPFHSPVHASCKPALEPPQHQSPVCGSMRGPTDKRKRCGVLTPRPAPAPKTAGQWRCDIPPAFFRQSQSGRCATTAFRYIYRRLAIFQTHRLNTAQCHTT